MTKANYGGVICYDHGFRITSEVMSEHHPSDIGMVILRYPCKWMECSRLENM